jgi:hypothetical protein
LEQPKSASLTRKFSINMRFCGLISRCRRGTFRDAKA